jgi:hypothetical protein
VNSIAQFGGVTNTYSQYSFPKFGADKRPEVMLITEDIMNQYSEVARSTHKLPGIDNLKPTIPNLNQEKVRYVQPLRSDKP